MCFHQLVWQMIQLSLDFVEIHSVVYRISSFWKKSIDFCFQHFLWTLSNLSLNFISVCRNSLHYKYIYHFESLFLNCASICIEMIGFCIRTCRNPLNHIHNFIVLKKSLVYMLVHQFAWKLIECSSEFVGKHWMLYIILCFHRKLMIWYGVH